MSGRPEPPLRQRRSAFYESSRPEVQALVPISARRILDLGCSSGALGAALKNRQAVEVVGVELDPEYAAAARAGLDHVVEEDIEALLQRGGLDSELGRFDCIIAADVLEHLVDPWAALARAVSLLDSTGSVILSLPNIRYWETFYQLGIKGVWPRRSVGIFDQGHLRFFTINDARLLLREARLEVVEVRPQYRFAPSGTRYDRHARKLHRTKLRSFFAFQYVLAAQRL